MRFVGLPRSGFCDFDCTWRFEKYIFRCSALSMVLEDLDQTMKHANIEDGKHIARYHYLGTSLQQTYKDDMADWVLLLCREVLR
ncbi:hypothetical protein I3760_04G178200 [Carya illinoinensis]|uniref:Uncharacterized protein n=1 Tax=Carya illinoinensis TaxID=32201 RepID=A0A8T1QWS1_CARIL|nr:hypothetical protein I3760_04G178200 [Carya illinoinensis]KAG6658708.1 hypothetical protein CIPAW_04G180600 [Carya illinoinensis]KAG6658709.1 hypothetical protein CIPAW_04G180600 [Carya illinoinensis]